MDVDDVPLPILLVEEGGNVEATFAAIAFDHDHHYFQVLTILLWYTQTLFCAILLVALTIFTQAPEGELAAIGAGGDVGDGDVGEAGVLVRPFPCDPPCEFSATTKPNLVQHQKGTRCYHRRAFFCDSCNQRFTTQDSKDRHFKKGRCVQWVRKDDPSLM